MHCTTHFGMDFYFKKFNLSQNKTHCSIHIVLSYFESCTTKSYSQFCVGISIPSVNPRIYMDREVEADWAN